MSETLAQTLSIDAMTTGDWAKTKLIIDYLEPFDQGYF